MSVAKSVASSLLEFCREAVERKLSKVVTGLVLGHLMSCAILSTHAIYHMVVGGRSRVVRLSCQIAMNI